MEIDGYTVACSASSAEQKEDTWDIEAYDAAASVCREIFLQRRCEYGSHLSNPLWYDLANLKVKLWRLLKPLLRGKKPKDDTLVDLCNYCMMIVSRRFVKTAG